MTTPSFIQFRTYSEPANSLTPEQVLERILSCLAVQTSGFNPDGTAYAQPVIGVVSGGSTPGDGVANPIDATDTRDFLEVWNGATWDRVKEGNVVGSVLVTGPGSGGSLPTTTAAPTAANILDGFITTQISVANSVLITIPAGRTWIGYVTLNCAVTVTAASTAAGLAEATISTAGVGVTPGAGNYLSCDATAGANSATGTVGSQGANSVSSRMVVIAPAGNAVTIQLTTVAAGSTAHISASAIGELQ